MAGRLRAMGYASLTHPTLAKLGRDDDPVVE